MCTHSYGYITRTYTVHAGVILRTDMHVVHFDIRSPKIYGPQTIFILYKRWESQRD